MVQQLIDQLLKVDLDLYLHSLRVAQLAEKIAEKMNFSPVETKWVHLGGMLHDIGKLAGNESHNHPLDGYRMLETLNLPDEVKRITLYHHERCDGSGYPFGLSGKQIPVYAQIVSAADYIDKLMNRKTWLGCKSVEYTVQQLNTERDIHFRAEVIDAFFEEVRRPGRIPLSPLRQEFSFI